jgi:hypothetical protein
MEADRALGNLAVRRQDLMEEFRTMRERLLGVADDLEAVVDDDGEADTKDTGSFPAAKLDRSSGNGIWDSNDTVRLPELSPTPPEDDEEQRDH